MAAAASASEAPALPKASGEELVCAAAAGELGLVESLLALGAPAGHRARKAGEEASGHDVGDSPLVAAAKGASITLGFEAFQGASLRVRFPAEPRCASGRLARL